MTYSPLSSKKLSDPPRRAGKVRLRGREGDRAALVSIIERAAKVSVAGANAVPVENTRTFFTTRILKIAGKLRKHRQLTQRKQKHDLMVTLAAYHLGLENSGKRPAALLQESKGLSTGITGPAGQAAQDDPETNVVVLRLFESEAFQSKLRVLINESLAGKAVPIDEAGLKESALAGDALANARARGIAGMRAELDSEENLSLRDAAATSGQSEKHVNSLRNGGRLYALVLDGATRHFRYPRWQFDADPRRLTPVLAVLGAKGISCWAVHDFMKRPHSDLGQPPMHAIIGGTVPVEAIIAAVHQRFNDADQGAA